MRKITTLHSAKRGLRKGEGVALSERESLRAEFRHIHPRSKRPKIKGEKKDKDSE